MSLAEPESALVRLSVTDGVALMSINRAERMNALSPDTIAQLVDAFATVKTCRAARVVVLRGEGDRAFCTGADLVKIDGDEEDIEHARGALGRLFLDMWSLGKPIIARVSGYALAGGFGLAMASDLVVASENSVFGTPEINVGLWPFMIMVPLLRSLPRKTALELMMTGRRVAAREAEQLGFVNEVVPVGELDTRVAALAAELASKPPEAMRLGRNAYYAVQDHDGRAVLAHLNEQLTIALGTDDAREGLAAFAEKRPPNWGGSAPG
jgi:enoyl-CoA hydratase/carnithine racemase